MGSRSYSAIMGGSTQEIPGSCGKHSPGSPGCALEAARRRLVELVREPVVDEDDLPVRAPHHVRHLHVPVRDLARFVPASRRYEN